MKETTTPTTPHKPNQNDGRQPLAMFQIQLSQWPQETDDKGKLKPDFSISVSTKHYAEQDWTRLFQAQIDARAIPVALRHAAEHVAELHGHKGGR